MVGTVVFMGLYMMLVERSPQDSIPPTSISANDHKGPTKTRKGPSQTPQPTVSRIPSKYDISRFGEQAKIEDPYPVFGKEYDSPLDAVPGRLRPTTLVTSTKVVPTANPLPKPAAKPEAKPSPQPILKPVAKPESKPAINPTAQSTPKPVVEPPTRPAQTPSPGIKRPAKEQTAATVQTKPSAKPEAQQTHEGYKPKPIVSTEQDVEEGKSEPTKAQHKKPTIKVTTAVLEPIPPSSVKSALPAGTNQVTTPFDDYVAICLVIKNQHEDLSEWLVHHYYHLGIRNFYIMDDGSSPPLESIKNTFGIPISTLTFEYLDTSAYKSPPQLDIYTRCISQYGDKHTWMAFLSPNEFLEITEEGENLAGILLDLEQDDGIGALAVNWQMHTSSGLLKRPDSTRKAFVECIWDDVENGGKFSNNTHVKSIVRTEKVLKPKNFYTWVLKDGDRKSVV